MMLQKETKTDDTEAFCLVLGGGGAKGVYHIGVWRALKKLGIHVDCFIGTSIGAVIAAFLAQGSDEILEQIGHIISLDNILDLPEDFIKNGELKFNLQSLRSLPDFFISVINNRGLDTKPFRQLIESNLDEKALRNSGKDFGVVTINVSDLKHQEVFIEDMEQGSVVDYLLASSAFPGFKNPKIEGKSFIDGGIYDNIPYAMARKRGYRRIIVSDLSGMGRTRKPDIAGCITVYIKNSIDMGWVLDLNRNFLDSFMLLGYLDTLRTFGHLAGYSYFIEFDTNAEKNFAPKISIPFSQSPKYMCYDRRKLLIALESAASVLNVERIRTYTYAELRTAIAEHRYEVENKITAATASSHKGIMNLAKVVSEAVATRQFTECPYYYYCLVNKLFPKSTARILKNTLVRIFPELPVGAAFIEGMESDSLNF
ncbi:MAG: patatin-like phospholipase family protein [Rectinema subterraneum]